MPGFSMLLLAWASGPQVPPPISDKALLAYFAKPWDQERMMFKRVVLGVNRGAVVVAEFPCSDVCPGNTRRIIHYDVAPGPKCRRIGGVVRQIYVPMSIAVFKKPFCVPRVLANREQ